MVFGIHIGECVRDRSLETTVAENTELFGWLNSHADKTVTYLALEVVIEVFSELREWPGIDRREFDQCVGVALERIDLGLGYTDFAVVVQIRCVERRYGIRERRYPRRCWF